MYFDKLYCDLVAAGEASGALEKIYDWSIGHVDDSLITMSRQFDISRASTLELISFFKVIAMHPLPVPKSIISIF